MPNWFNDPEITFNAIALEEIHIGDLISIKLTTISDTIVMISLWRPELGFRPQGVALNNGIKGSMIKIGVKMNIDRTYVSFS